ncbi:hypothetical protein [Bacteroides sp. 519]|uniref:hypothetical protein n=1 Tax=Bacteroides sp. 519 TaxID=2302937 RepID=UPI0013D13DE4|nr:hypothetical protein [Bacteroides sp. 519]NDV58905.1 hypothetical protein [Bacteroides sp. 519]
MKDDFLLDETDDEQTIEFIKNYLPQELKEKFTDDELYYFMDVMDEFYAESGILDAEPDEEGYVNIDLEEVAKFIAAEAKKDKIGEYDPEEILFVVQGEMEYGNSIGQVE